MRTNDTNVSRCARCGAWTWCGICKTPHDRYDRPESEGSWLDR